MKYQLSKYAFVTDVLNPDEPTPNLIIFSSRNRSMMIVRDDYYQAILTQNFDLIPIDILQELLKYRILINPLYDECEEVLQESHLKNQDRQSLEFQFIINFPDDDQDLFNDPEKGKILHKEIIAYLQKLLHENVKELSIVWELNPFPQTFPTPILSLMNHIADLGHNHELTYHHALRLDINELDNLDAELLIGELGFLEFKVYVGKYNHIQNLQSSNPKISPISSLLRGITELTNHPLFDSKKCLISLDIQVDRHHIDHLSQYLEYLSEMGLQKKVRVNFSHAKHGQKLSIEEFAGQQMGWVVEAIKCGLEVTSIIPKENQTFHQIVIGAGPTLSDPELVIRQKYQETENTQLTLEEIQNIRAKMEHWCSHCHLLPVCGGDWQVIDKEENLTCSPAKYNLEDRLMLSYISMTHNLADVF